MKATLVLSLLVTFTLVTFMAPAVAQGPDLQAAEAACGPAGVQFGTQTSTDHTPPQVESGKSQVYVVEIFDKNAGQLARPTLRVGIDGKWAGAVKGSSYLSFPVDPGEHHLCTNWQSVWKHFSQKAAFTNFTADAGKAYYFRAHIIESGPTGSGNFTLDLEPVNEDEGKYLVAANSLAVSHAKQ
jgi:hypothetical protein